MRLARRTSAGALHTIEGIRARRGAEGTIPLSHENFRYRHFLAPTYLDYVSRISWADHAVSLETAAVLAQLCEKRRPARVLDTGSGYSSYVLRKFTAGFGGHVTSVDDDREWMEKTRGFLAAHGLSESGAMLDWQRFTSTSHLRFDLIFHDLGTFETRIRTAWEVTSLLAPEGAIVYDDVHEPRVRRSVRAACGAAGRPYYSMRSVTLDAISRYAALSLAA